MLARKCINYLRTSHTLLFSPVLCIHGCIHSPSRLMFLCCQPAVTCRGKSGIPSSIHFGQLFHTLYAAQISVIFYYLCCCHFCKMPHSLYFVQTGAPFRFHLLTRSAILGEAGRQCAEPSTKGSAAPSSSSLPISSPGLPSCIE